MAIFYSTFRCELTFENFGVVPLFARDTHDE